MHMRHKRIVTKQEGAGPRTLPGPAPSRFKPLSQPPRSCSKHRPEPSASTRSRRGRSPAMTLRNGSTWAWSASRDYGSQARWVLLFEGITLGEMPHDGQKTERCADKARVGAGSGFRCGETYPETRICYPTLLGRLNAPSRHCASLAFLVTNTGTTRKSHALRPVTRTRRRKQGTEVCSRQCGALSRCQRKRAFVPCSLERQQASATDGTRTNGKRLRQREHATTACARAASYSKYLAAPTGMHWRIRPTNSVSSKSMPWSNQWRVQPAQPFEKKSRQNPVSPSSSTPCTRTRAPNASHSARCITRYRLFTSWEVKALRRNVLR